MADLCHHRYLSEVMDRLYPPGERRPRMMTLELTRRCNFGCAHCYCRLPVDSPPPRPELTTEQWQRIIEEATDAGVFFALFTGGEPLVRDDFRELWRFARQRGLLCILFTNATLVDEEMADFLAEWTPREVAVSLYGASEETYRRVTGRPGMHERALRGVELLQERGLIAPVRSIVTRQNVHEFEALREQSTRYHDLFRWDAELILAYSEGGGDPGGVRLTPEELVALEARDGVRAAEWRKLAEQWKPAPASPDTPYRCAAGSLGFVVNPYGVMHPCLGLEAIRVDLLQTSLEEAWAALPEAIARTIGPPGPCQECVLPPFCRQCPADNLLEGRPTGHPVPWRCEMARLRAEAYGLPAQPPA